MRTKAEVYKEVMENKGFKTISETLIEAMDIYAREVLDEFTNLTKGVVFTREDVRRNFIKDFKEKLK